MKKALAGSTTHVYMRHGTIILLVVRSRAL